MSSHPSFKGKIDILMAPKIEKSSSSLFSYVNAKNLSGTLWLVSEDTVSLFEHMEIKFGALFRQNSRKINAKKIAILFLLDSCVRNMLDFLEEKSCQSVELCEEVLLEVISLFIRIRIYRHLKHFNNSIKSSSKAMRANLKTNEKTYK